MQLFLDFYIYGKFDSETAFELFGNHDAFSARYCYMHEPKSLRTN